MKHIGFGIHKLNLDMSDKRQQKATENAEVNATTGLTPIQEQAAILLASGDTITTVAEKIGVNRSTLYKWQMKVTFQCFFNRQCKDYKDNLRNGLFGLAGEALNAIRGCLHSENETTRLKAAMWLADKVELSETGSTDVREAIKLQYTKNEFDDWGNTFDRRGYENELTRLGLSLEE